MADLDRLEVQVEASAAKANAELNKLVNKLDKVASSLSGINSSGLVGFANGIEKLGKSMQTMNAVKTSDFTRLAKNIQKLSTLNTAGLNTASSAFLLFGKSLANFGAAAKSAEGIAAMAKNISKLGGKNVQNAIESMPRLAEALKGLMTTLAQAPNVSKNVIQMTRALAELTNALKGAQNGGSGSGGNSGADNVNKLSAAFARLTGSITRSKITMKSFAQIAGKFYVNCFLIIRAIKRLGQAINKSMDYVETYNYFAVTMDKIGKEFSGMYAQYGYDSAEEYARSFTDRMNELTRKMTGYKIGENGELTLTDSIGLALDPEAIMNYQSSLAAVTNSVGLIGENSVNVSKALTMLSADMSSLKNIDLKTVMTNFQSGLIGQSRALYKYGIDITNATLQTYAYNLGLCKSVSEMTQAEKMQLRILAILDQSRVAWGDQANTINSVANQYRIMKQQLSNLARTIGNLFLPIVRKVLPIINGFIIALQRLFTTLGFKLWGGNWLKDNMEGISGGYADDSLGALGDDADDAADSLGNAAKAAEKLKTTVLGIDELNINAPQEESGSGSGAGGAGGSIDLSNAIEGALADYESVWDEAFAKAQNRAQEFADAICRTFERIWRIAEPTRAAIARLWNDGLAKFSNFAFGTLMDFWNNFLKPVGKWMLGDNSGLPRFFNITNALLNDINWGKLRKSLSDFYKALKKPAKFAWTGLMDFYEHFLRPVSVWTMNKALPVLVNTITAFSEKVKWDKLNKALASLFKTISKFAVGIGQGIINFFEMISPIVTDALSGTIEMLSIALNGFFAVFGMIPRSLIEGIGFALAAFFTVFYGSKAISEIAVNIGKGLLFLKDKITILFAALQAHPWIAAATAITAAIGAIYSVVKQTRDEINESEINSVFTSIKENGVTSLEALGQAAERSFGQVTDGAEQAKEKLSSISMTKASIDATVENIDSIRRAVDAGAYSVSEKIPEIVEQFEDLLSDSKSIFEEEYAVIVGNLSGAWNDYLEAQGVAVPESIALLAKARDEAVVAFSDMEGAIKSLTEQYNNGEIGSEEYYEKISPLIDKLSSINKDGSIDNAVKSIQDFGGSLDMKQYIKDGSFDQAKFSSDIGSVGQAALDGKNNIEEAAEGSIEALNDVKLFLETFSADSSNIDWVAFYGASDAQVTQGKQAIDSAYRDYADQVQYCLLEQLPDIIDEATAGYEELNWWQKLFTTKEGYIQGAINEWNNNILSPATESIQLGFEELGIEGEVWATEAAEKMSGSLFETFTRTFHDGSSTTTQTLKSNWESILSDALSGAAVAVDAESYGKDTVDGFNKGINNNSSSSYEAIREWMSSIDGSIHDSDMDFGSPSKTAWNYGEDTIDGFNNGIIENISSTKAAINEWLTGITESFSSETWSELFSGMSAGLQKEWSEAVVWWQNTAMPSWMNEVRPWFSLERWTEICGKIKDALKGVWDSTVLWWKSSVSRWWGENVIPWFSLERWKNLGTNMKEGLVTGFKGIVQSMGNIMNGIIDVFNAGLSRIAGAVNSLVDSFNSSAGELGVSSLQKVQIQSIAHVKIPAFAAGGYPNTGELFLARENGINEMVGRIGSRSAVANNDQITDAIRAAVVQGMDTEEQNALLREQNSLLRAILAKDTDVTLDGKSLVNGIDKARKRMGWNFQAT